MGFSRFPSQLCLAKYAFLQLCFCNRIIRWWKCVFLQKKENEIQIVMVLGPSRSDDWMNKKERFTSVTEYDSTSFSVFHTFAESKKILSQKFKCLRLSPLPFTFLQKTLILNNFFWTFNGWTSTSQNEREKKMAECFDWNFFCPSAFQIQHWMVNALRLALHRNAHSFSHYDIAY